VTEAETCCHLVTLKKINIYNTGVLAREFYSLFVYIEHNGDESPKDETYLFYVYIRTQCVESS